MFKKTWWASNPGITRMKVEVSCNCIATHFNSHLVHPKYLFSIYRTYDWMTLLCKLSFVNCCSSSRTFNTSFSHEEYTGQGNSFALFHAQNNINWFFRKWGLLLRIAVTSVLRPWQALNRAQSFTAPWLKFLQVFQGYLKDQQSIKGPIYLVLHNKTFLQYCSFVICVANISY